MNIRLYFIFIVIFFITELGLSQEAIDFNSVGVHRIASVNPNDTDFEDLEFLKTMLSKTKVLFLGEKSHGEGTITLAKTRLIKYLIDSLNYNVLAFESGIYDACIVNELAKNNKDGGNSFRAAFPYILYNTVEFSGMKELILKKIKTGKITLCGIDCQLGSISYNTLISTVSDSLSRFGYSIDSTSIELINRYVWNRKSAKTQYFENKSDSLKLLDTFNKLIFYTKKLNNDTNNLLNHAIINLKTDLELHIMDYYSAPMYLRASKRDKQMANNLLWILNHGGSNTKIIVWSASMHNARHVNLIKDVSDTTFYNNYIPMGHIIYNVLGNDMYSLAFTASGGYFQTPFMMKDSIAIKSKDSNSVEAYFNKNKYEYGIINFRKKNSYFNKELYSNPHGNSNTKAVWPKIHDGIFYIDTIYSPRIIK
jgi:erythromycin esterase